MAQLGAEALPTNLVDLLAAWKREEDVIRRAASAVAADLVATRIAAVERAGAPLLRWLGEAAASTMSARPRAYFRERFAEWEQEGAAKLERDGRRWRRLYLRACVVAVRVPTRAHREGSIYVLRRPSTGAIKIGFSTDVDARVRTLSSQSGEQLVRLACFAGTLAGEAELHDRFADCRHVGEWFGPSPELLAWIAAVSGEDT